jgi:uncharacterized BrkB/YihY/UPF0761 family membrane protein
MAPKISFKGMREVFVNSFKGFQENKVTKLTGSLAFYTVFSMGPLFILIISLGGLILGKEAVEGRLYAQIADFIGSGLSQTITRKSLKMPHWLARVKLLRSLEELLCFWELLPYLQKSRSLSI